MERNGFRECARPITRTGRNGRGLVDLFYQRYEDRVAENPDGHAMDYIHCYIAIEKIDK